MADETRDNDPEGLEPTELPPTASSPPIGEAGNQIGPYRLLQKVGEGGMGEVYKAEQTHPVRRLVALKVIKAGMDTKQVVARFEAERQALALMDHPAVAKVFDAGATSRGRPYFVMEYVKGVPITEHCDRHKLTTRERLDLFMQVCEGVQHAHQKAIIHRDLKPSNVLVALREGEPEPKIIDFGVAKAIAQKLTERTMFTELGVLIGTPEYMSPEQAEMTGQEVDTRTDVYSLGVMLYELLTGALPFDSKELRSAGLDGIRRRIREEELPKPSTRLNSLGDKRSTESARRRRVDLPTLRRQLSGDLDWITMKALEKDLGRRYGSPQELAMDIRRYLKDEPVLASPPSKVYQAGKFIRRHRVGVAVTAAGALVLLAFALTMTIQTGRIAAERDRANTEARRAKASQLLTLGGLELERDRTKTLAYALASLEQADSPDGRRLALRALWNGPSAFYLPPRTRQVWGLDFSPDGRWLAGGEYGGDSGSRVFLWPADGQAVTDLPFSDVPDEIVKTVRFVPNSNVLFSAGYIQPAVKLWSVRDGQLIRSMDVTVPAPQGRAGGQGVFPDAKAERLVSASLVRANSAMLFQLWAMDKEEPQLLDSREVEGVTDWLFSAIAALDPTGNRLAYGKGSEIFLVDFATSGQQAERLLGRHDAPLARLAFHPDGESLAAIDQRGEIRLWSLASVAGKAERSIQSVELCFDLRFDRDGGRLAASSGAGFTQVVDLAAPPAAEWTLLRGLGGQMNAAAFHPAGEWIATSGNGRAVIWPLGRSYPRVLRGHTQAVTGIAFGPQGNWIVSGSGDRTLRMWQLDSASAERHRIVYEGEGIWAVRVSPGGENLLATSTADPVVVAVSDGKERSLSGFIDGPKSAVAFGPHGRRAAVGGGGDHPPDAKIRVWDLDSDDVLVLDPGDGKMVTEIAFTSDGALVSASGSGDLRLWDLASGTFRVLRQSAVSQFALSRDGRRLLGIRLGKVSLHDLQDGSIRELVTHGSRVSAVALDPNGVTAVTASGDGTIRVGPVTGEEPHLLLGHEGSVHDLAVSPDGLWIASAGADSTVRLWPMPEGRPFHTLAYEEFLERLRALTNLRVVEDEQSGTGYGLDVSAFPGWESLPTW